MKYQKEIKELHDKGFDFTIIPKLLKEKGIICSSRYVYQILKSQKG